MCSEDEGGGATAALRVARPGAVICACRVEEAPRDCMGAGGDTTSIGEADDEDAAAAGLWRVEREAAADGAAAAAATDADAIVGWSNEKDATVRSAGGGGAAEMGPGGGLPPMPRPLAELLRAARAGEAWRR